MDITQKQQLLFHLNAVLVANSILMYDHIMTLPEEIAFIWGRPKLLSATLFLANRYIALVGNIFGLFIDFLPAVSDERFQPFFEYILLFSYQSFSCSRYMLVRELFLYLQQIIVCVILTLRVYALYGRSRRLLSYIIIIGLALMGGASAGSFGNNSNTTIYIPGSDCHNTFTAKTAMRYGLAWIAVFVFELLIFVLTVFRACKTRGSPRLIPSSKNIIDIMFRDGAMYFAAMTLINLPNILTYYCGSDITRGNLATFTGCMSVTLVSRLVLHLHKSTYDGILSTAIQNDDSSPNVFTTRLDAEFSSHSFQADSG